MKLIEIGQRITSGWRRFGEYNIFLREREIPICLKRKIIDTVVLPAMTYAAETWSHKKTRDSSLWRRYVTVTRWCKEFQEGSWISFGNRSQSGRPKTIGGSDTVRKIAELVRNDKRLTVHHLQDLTTHSKKCDTLGNDTEDLKLKKLCALWVAHLLGPEEKQQQINKARDLLQLFNCRRWDLWVTGNESWFMFH